MLQSIKKKYFFLPKIYKEIIEMTRAALTRILAPPLTTSITGHWSTREKRKESKGRRFVGDFFGSVCTVGYAGLFNLPLL